MNHDIIHCGNEDCKNKERCYRFNSYLELQEKQMSGCYSLYFFDEKVDSVEKCKLPWLDMGIHIEDEDDDYIYIQNKP